MRTVESIYTEYRIMPGLQLHQLRVGAVAKTICDNLNVSVRTDDVVLAALFHDMGNIIKADLVTFPDFLGDKGYDYWKQVKNEYIAKYGPEEHHATIQIAGEMGLPQTVIDLIDGVGFSKLVDIRDSSSLEQKIVEYADLRVGPYGVLSLVDRLEEAKRRYANRQHSDMSVGQDRYNELVQAARDIEETLFSNCAIKPEDINDASIADDVRTLRTREILS